MSFGVKFKLNEHLFIRNPQDTDLGKKLIKYSIILIDEIGFEAFTFKKLAKAMSSTEASVYRYFENKHFLLIYLVSWYWEWVSYLIDINTMNIEDPDRKLRIVIANIVKASMENPAIDYVNESVLHRIVIAEGAKAYHTKSVDVENKEGLFLDYEDLVSKVAAILLEVNPKFPYPRTLASNLFEMSNNQVYFAQHLPRLTDLKNKKNNFDDVEKMLAYFAFKMLEK